MQGCWDADVLWLSLSWGRCIHPIFPSHLGCYDKQTETSRPSEMPGIFRLLFVWASASAAAHRSQIEAVVSVGVVAWLWQEGAEIKACSKKGERQRDTERERCCKVDRDELEKYRNVERFVLYSVHWCGQWCHIDHEIQAARQIYMARAQSSCTTAAALGFIHSECSVHSRIQTVDHIWAKLVVLYVEPEKPYLALNRTIQDLAVGGLGELHSGLQNVGHWISKYMKIHEHKWKWCKTKKQIQLTE